MLHSYTNRNLGNDFCPTVFPPIGDATVPTLVIVDDPLFKYMPLLIDPTVTSEESSFVK